MSGITRRTFTGMAAAALGAAPMLARAETSPSGEPIKIGFSMSLTGGLAGNGRPALLAQQIWEKEINAKGGLLGRPVQLIYYDDQSSGAQVPGIYTKLFDVDKVDLVVSGYATAIIGPAMPVVMQHGAAFVTLLGSGTNDAFHYDRCCNINPVGGQMTVDYAKGFFDVAKEISPKPKTVAVAALDSDFPQRAMKSVRTQAKLNGIEVVYDRSYPPGTVDFTPIVRAIQAAKPDLVYFCSYPPDSVGLLQAVADAKLGAMMLGGGMIGPQITAIKAKFGPALNNLVCWDIYVPEPTMNFPGVTAFLERYRAAAASEKVDPLGLYAPPMAYSQMQVLEQAVTRVGKIDQAAIGADFHKSEFPTIIGNLAFDELGEWRQERNLYTQFQGIQGNDLEQFKRAGTEVILYPPALKSGKLRTPFPAA